MVRPAPQRQYCCIANQKERKGANQTPARSLRLWDDIGKSVFHVMAVDRKGAVIQRSKFARDALQSFFDLAPKALIGMEACPGSQWLARKLIGIGHDARIIPARFVKPHVKSNKTDTVDVAAVAEALTRPTMCHPTGDACIAERAICPSANCGAG